MVGGKIVGLIRRPAGPTTVNVQDTRYSGRDFRAIDLREVRKDNGMPVELSLGDSIWWQGGDAMWTPGPMGRPLPADRCSKDWDIHLPREGYSFSS